MAGMANSRTKAPCVVIWRTKGWKRRAATASQLPSEAPYNRPPPPTRMASRPPRGPADGFRVYRARGRRERAAVLAQHGGLPVDLNAPVAAGLVIDAEVVKARDSSVPATVVR